MSLFAADTAVRADTPGTFSGQLAAAWNIGDNPNGGYMVCCALRAMAAAIEHPDPLSVTTHFLRPGMPDMPFQVQIEILRHGRSMTTAEAHLLQDGKVRLVVLAAWGDLAQQAGIDAEYSTEPPTQAEPDDCLQRSEAAQNIHLPILSRLDTRLDPACVEPANNPVADVRGHIRFVDGTPPDTLALALFCDAFPPSPLLRIGHQGWVPTLELTVHIRRRPAPGWITACLRSDDLQAGRMVESGQFWDSQGHLVAQSRQLGLVMHREE